MMDGISNIVFQNPELKSLELVQLNVPGDGAHITVPALSKHFVEKRYFLHYEAPKLFEADGTEIIGAKDYWIELMNYMIEDMIWLRGLPYHKFWSNIVYNPKIKECLTVYLQESPVFYDLDSFPDDKEMKQLLNKLSHNILIILARLITNAESKSEFMDRDILGKLLYDNYIFTIPLVLDICQHYGRDNQKVVKKIVDALFKLQPLYIEDTKQTIGHINQVFRTIEQRFENFPTPFVGEAVKLIDKGGASLEISLTTLKDIVLHILDAISTTEIFLKMYPPAIPLFSNDESFISRLISTYAYTIPEMYKRLHTFTDKQDNIEHINKMRHLLDVTRIESIEVYRMILYKNLEDVLEAPDLLPEEEIRNRVDSFIALMSTALSEREFYTDYTRLYPLDIDIDILTHICPTIDPEKIQFLTKPDDISDRNVNKSSQLQNDVKNDDEVSEEHLAFLVSEVKDVLCDLDEGLILKCLKYYKYNSESVINAVLEDTLPSEIKNQDICVLTDSNDKKDSEIIIDEIDDLCDRVTNTIIAAGSSDQKSTHEHENLHQMLDEKSHIRENKAIYERYNLVEDYESDYDDTYDDLNDVMNIQDDAIEIDRPFITPRVLSKKKNQQEVVVNNEDDSEENEEKRNTSRDFVEDPAKYRARMEERRMSKKGKKGKIPSERDVTGKPKGQGQDKTVTSNRNYKSTHKSSQANHNRRTGAAWKKQQGMVPS